MSRNKMASATWRFNYVGSITPPLDWHLYPQSHDHHELVVLMQGATVVRIDERPCNAVEGEVLIFRRGARHEERNDPQRPFRSIFVGFHGPDLPRFLPERLSDTAGRVRQLATWLYAERESHRADEKAARNAFFQALISEVLRLATHKDQPIVQRVRTYVRRHLAASLTVDDLASLAGMSKYHFIRSYKRATGRTPMADVRGIRATAARDLLLTSRLTLTEIADRCGLGDPPHFSRVMRDHFGVSPSHLR